MEYAGPPLCYEIHCSQCSVGLFSNQGLDPSQLKNPALYNQTYFSFFFNIYLMHSTSRKQLVCVPVTTEPFQSIQTNGCSLNRQEKDKHVSYNMLFLGNSLSNYKFLGPQGQKVRPTMHDSLLVCGQDQCPSCQDYHSSAVK